MQLFAGLDVHSAFTYGTVLDEDGNKIREMKVSTAEDGFEMLFSKFPKKSKVKAVFEASQNWPRVAHLIEQQHVTPIMAHPLKVRAIASARIKTDKIDSRTLAHLLRTDLIPESYMPPDNIVALRELLRYRVQLGQERANQKTIIRSILAREGKICACADVTSLKARKQFSELALLHNNRRELEHALAIAELHSKSIEDVEKEIDAKASMSTEAKLICSIPGFANYSAMLILSEIGDVHRFDSAEKLAAYSGLVSSTYQSSTTLHQGKITRQGSHWLRWILIQSTSIAVRKPNRLRQFYLRLKAKKGHNKAIVATARKTLTIIWTLLHKQEQFRP